MKVAVYAPLKSPDSAVPSGDRLIGRMLIAALRQGGHTVEIASSLRTFDRTGDGQRQLRLERIGDWNAARLIRRYGTLSERPDLWLTYHLYHKAPDWLGPVVARALGIPYCVVEASSAPRHATGPWAAGHAAVASALAAAALVIGINPKDTAGIKPLVGPLTRLAHVPPFINGQPFSDARAARAATRNRLARLHDLDPTLPWLLAVGMLRPGDKAASYDLLARALATLTDRPWQLIVVGDGAARDDIERRFASMAGRVRFAGQRSTADVAAFMAASDLLVWPSINEAIGMVFIEAAMTGLPAVAADRPGIAAVIEHGRTGLLVPEHDPAAFAAAVAQLLDDVPLRQALGTAATVRAAAQHDLGPASRLLCCELEAVIA
jgi:glycosyltransferase involved in cell wall biosynthesis